MSCRVRTGSGAEYEAIPKLSEDGDAGCQNRRGCELPHDPCVQTATISEGDGHGSAPWIMGWAIRLGIGVAVAVALGAGFLFTRLKGGM